MKKPKKPLVFEVRKNCEYVLEIEARDADHAIELAEAAKDDDWTQAWSPIEAEELDMGDA